MEKRKTDLKTFLTRVKQLRGFGDMDAYKAAADFKKISENDADESISNIIKDFSDISTYDKGKSALINKIESELKKTKNSI
ncbi:hypothetical protein [Pedobacter rhodius]|uniref:Uncharacterized protein n=1 Tax=Pedobacter rhodius TaxID=3004098 RepID=A0ABT4KWK4_9SPHI|nr:hypothetical protein [Pedobacter sp. SJ11]MCZ4223150.1 hypothetical protein [Pedobacter sp. SJ11]